MLFLRSFRDDDVNVRSVTGATFSLPPARLEETIANEARPYGPFVGLGAPGSLRDLGAARDYYAGEEWREAVLANIDQAGAVIVVAGATENLAWEIASLVQRGFLGKLILIFPPRWDGLHATRCRSVINLLARAPVGAALARADLSEAIAIHLAADGTLVIVTGRLNSAGEYQAAVRTSLYGVLMR